ncbi:HepP protein [Nostoc sp. NIES-2111]|nr:HepP protein [Nostoc sp. NIES-2111]
MTQKVFSSHQISECLILTEEWEAILKAIASGKYSWACILMLYTVGHNPLTYIPYSTYLRLVKKNNMPNVIKARKNNSTGVKFVAIKTKVMELD